MRRVGVLIGGDESDPERQTNVAAFRNALRDLGWTEGRTLHIDLRWAASDVSRARTYAAELVTLNPDAIFGDNTFVIEELKQATRTLPIIFARVTDPIFSGFVSSLALPGGNITGFADKEPSSLSKLVEIMREIAPNVTTVGLIAEFSGTAAREAAAATSSVGLKLVRVPTEDPREIENLIAALGKEPNTCLILSSGPFALKNRKLIIDLAARHKLPAIYSRATFVTDGGLMSYGPEPSDQYRGAARYVDRILKGAKPADLPVQLPINYQLVVNLNTAKALGLIVPDKLMAIADEVIQ
jgi:putative ABC transport system substrate-binding protein